MLFACNGKYSKEIVLGKQREMSRRKKDNSRQKKQMSEVCKILEAVAAFLTVILSLITVCIQKIQMEMNQQQFDWNQQQKAEELTPAIQISNKGTIMIGKDEYTKYVFVNGENSLTGGKLKKINGIIIVKCSGMRVKTLWIKDAVYNTEVPFDAKQQCAVIFYKDIEAMEQKALRLKDEIEECLKEQKETNAYEFEVQVGIAVTLEYSDRYNDIKELKYIVYLEDRPYCEVISGEIHCDRYYLEYGREEQGDEYFAVIQEAAARIVKECKEN